MQPTLSSERLILRPYQLADAPEVQRLAGDARIADTTLTIPHPYPDGAAEAWIAKQAAMFEAGSDITFAMTLRSNGALLGTVSLFGISAAHARGELGYWTVVEHWGAGYCTEAVGQLIPFVQQHLGISKIAGHCFARNPASARVMEKCGLRQEGLLRQHVRKHGRFEDLLLYGLTLPGRNS